MVDGKVYTNQYRFKGIKKGLGDKYVNSPVPLPIGSCNTKKG